jgi:hypothetical protein
LLVASALILAMVGFPGALTSYAAPGEPEDPQAPQAVTATMPPVIKQWAGINRLNNVAGDPDIFPPLVPPAGDVNDPTVLGAVPDVTGAAGYTHYIQAVNKVIAIYQKDGVLVELAPFTTFWTTAAAQFPAPPTTPCYTAANHHGQPYVMYDHLTLRWVVVDVAYANIDSGPYSLCIAVSKSNAVPPGPYPLGAGTYFNRNFWFFYEISTNEGNLHYYPDSVKMGLWPDGYYLAADMIDLESNGTVRNPRGAKVWAVNRSDLVGGQISTFRYVAKFLPEQRDREHLLPSNLLGSPPPSGTPAYFATIEATKLYIWEFRVNWPGMTSQFGLPCGVGVPPPAICANYVLNTNTGNLDARVLVPQPFTDELVDAHGERLMSPLQYRIVDGIPSLWTTYTVQPAGDQTPTGLRWHELQFAADGTPNFTQTGTYRPEDVRYRWLPSLAVDRAGNMAIGFSESAPTPQTILDPIVYPSIYYAGRLRDNPVGQLPLGERDLFKGLGSQFDTDFALGSDYDGFDGPWGRASHMSIDPLDDCVFWYTNMYYPASVQGQAVNSNWNTRIGFFTLKECRGGMTRRVSLSTANVQGNQASGEDFEDWGRTVAISADGRYVAFSSEATNLVSNDTNGLRDVFVRDRDYDADGIFDEPDAVQTVCISCRGYDGSHSLGDSWEVSISSTGRYIAFSSDASNLVSGDSNGSRDVFVYDRSTGQMKRVSVMNGTENGNAFGDSDQPFISGSGNCVVFRSVASTLVGGDTNLVSDIFLRPMAAGNTTTARVSVLSPPAVPNQLIGESVTPSVSSDCSRVAYATRDQTLGPSLGYADPNLNTLNPILAGQGLDVFLANFSTAANVVTGVRPVSYVSTSTPLAGTMGSVTLPPVLASTGESYYPYISASGNQVVFASRATDLLPAGQDTNIYADIFVWDATVLNALGVPTISRVSTNFFSGQANNNSYNPSISNDGRYVTFSSDASNLDAFLPDTNGLRDVFLHDRGMAAFGIYNVGLTQRISLDTDRGDANGQSLAPAIASLGGYVAFPSEANDLVGNDSNSAWDVFVYDMMYQTPIFLRIPGNVPGSPGATVSMPVTFSRNGYNIDTTTFSIDFDENCLEFNPATPNAVVFSTPADFLTSWSFNAADINSEIDISVYDQLAPRSYLPDGTLVTVKFKVKATCQAIPGSSNTARVGFSITTPPSFGSYGQSIRGRSMDGFITIQNGRPGDCNGDGLVDAGDLSALVLEIFDGDGVLPIDTPKSTFPGNPVGCNSNQDDLVDAGDLSCTVLINWGMTCGGASSRAAFTPRLPSTSASLSLDLPAMVPAKPGGKVTLPVMLTKQGSPVNSLIFSLDYDQTWLSFDPTDGNQDGLPDAVNFNLPSGFSRVVTFDAKDPDGELDFVVFNPASPSLELPDGAVANVTFDVKNPPGDFLAKVDYSQDPAASFGSTTGQSVNGLLQNGSVWISRLVNYLYLPLTRR